MEGHVFIFFLSGMSFKEYFQKAKFKNYIIKLNVRKII